MNRYLNGAMRNMNRKLLNENLCTIQTGGKPKKEAQDKPLHIKRIIQYNKGVTEDKEVRKFKEILYSCMEDLLATKAALYMLGTDGEFHLKTFYGFQKNDYLPKTHSPRDVLIETLYMERKSFYFNSVSHLPALIPLLNDANTSRILVSPVYVERIVGFLDIRDKAGKKPFTNEDCIKADSIAMRIADVIKQKMIAEKEKGEIPLGEGVSSSIQETLYAKVDALVTQPLPKTLQPLNRPFPELIKVFHQTVDFMLTFTPFDLLLIPFYTPTGGFFLQGGKGSLPQRVLTNLHEECQQFLKKQKLPFYVHNYLPGGNILPEGTLKRLVNHIILHTPFVSILGMVFIQPEKSYPNFQEVNIFFSHIRNQFETLTEHKLQAQTMTTLLHKFLAPGLEDYSSLVIHSKNVAKIARGFCEKLKISSREIQRITDAALLHDVGMRELDYRNLYHKKSLSEQDLHLIKQHPKVGAYLIQDVAFPYDLYSLVLYHHERWDGSGYPGHLMGEQIPLGARIIHIIEAWDAMTSKDSYRPTLPPHQALEILKSKGGIQFDPHLVPQFIAYAETELIP